MCGGKLEGGTKVGVYLSSSPKILPQIKKIIPKPLFFLKIYPYPLCLSKIIYPQSFKKRTIYPLSLVFIDTLS